MNTDDLRSAVLEALSSVAPEAELDRLDRTEDVREALDLDSMDVLRFATALHERLGVDVPEADYTRIATIDGCVSYLERRLSAGVTGQRR
jgi:acyl carrier protein